MRFLVQKIDNKLTLDFCHELMVSQIYSDWRGDRFIIKYANNEIPKDLKHPENYIPIGTVEFVSDFVNTYFPDRAKLLEPLNVPECLKLYAGRFVWDIVDTKSDTDEYQNLKCYVGNDDVLYRKSLTKIKDCTNGFIRFNKDKPFELEGYQVSKNIMYNILSEWRVFVYHNKVQQVCYYDGDPLVFPDGNKIQMMVDEYSRNNAPVAYTLDVYNTKNGTFVMECHRFFSCGLYGFSDYRILPYMFSQEWYEMMNTFTAL